MNKAKITALPTTPGVYLFKDAHGTVVYIGKAKNIRHRVRSYFQKKNSDMKIEAINHHGHDVDFISTTTEMSAGLLEAELIQKYKPSLNTLLKEGQPFVYLLFTQEAVPHIKLVRNKHEKGTYFGPFIHKSQARNVHRFLIETFALGACNKKLEHGCLDYHIGICPGSCKSTFSRDDYLFRLSLAKDVLNQHSPTFIERLQERIMAHNRLFEFEKSRQLSSYLTQVEFIFRAIKERYSARKFAVATCIATTPAPDIAQNYVTVAHELGTLLAIPPVYTIDCFDISHFQGQYQVGSAVRFSNGKPDKNQFRRFLIRTAPANDDYAALQEIVARRYKKNQNFPDLMLIDGGKGQLSVIQQRMPQAHIASLAKREERLFSAHHPEGTVLNVKTSPGKQLIALRDYAHHFAISYHRLKRGQKFSDAHSKQEKPHGQ